MKIKNKPLIVALALANIFFLLIIIILFKDNYEVKKELGSHYYHSMGDLMYSMPENIIHSLEDENTDVDSIIVDTNKYYNSQKNVKRLYLYLPKLEDFSWEVYQDLLRLIKMETDNGSLIERDQLENKIIKDLRKSMNVFKDLNEIIGSNNNKNNWYEELNKPSKDILMLFEKDL
ncbi:hypothetical protein [Brassicibacter mesophilus]|uniref:hypothetical protein n=1 Tax=Brassicibacter mesophilus TaxID=745119 RepID=UPI003D209C97